AGDSYPPSGPHRSGPHGSGLHGSGPHPSGAHVMAGDPFEQGERPSSDPRVSGAVTAIDRPSQPSHSPSFDSALTSLRWPPGMTGSTGRGVVTTSRPPSLQVRGTWL